jgi:hypothetical protein
MDSRLLACRLQCLVDPVTYLVALGVEECRREALCSRCAQAIDAFDRPRNFDDARFDGSGRFA